MANRWGKVETETDFNFLGSKTMEDSDCSHKIKRYLLLERKAMTNLDSILKNRYHFANQHPYSKAMVFPVIMYGCWTTKKAEMKWSEVAQSCPTLCNPMDCNLPGFSVHQIFQAQVLEWVAISFSKRRLSAKEFMLLNCDAGDNSWELLR